MKISFTHIILTIILYIIIGIHIPIHGQGRHHDINLSFISGTSFTKITHSLYPESTTRQNNILGGIEFEYALNKLQALSIGITRSSRGVSFKQQPEITYRYWDIPLAFIHYLPLKRQCYLSFRAGITPMFISKNNASAPSQPFILEGLAGIGFIYEFIFNWKFFIRGEYGYTPQSVHNKDNSYFRQGGRFSEGRLVFGISYNLNPDPLRKKQHKIPECLK